jgi:outer membrane immunogenic protein
MFRAPWQAASIACLTTIFLAATEEGAKAAEVFPIHPISTSVPNSLAFAQSGSFSNNQSGFVGGGQVGYDYQLGRFVIGIETDMQGAGIHGVSQGIGAGLTNSSSSNPFGTINASSSSLGATSISSGVTWLGTVRGRVGYLIIPTVLAYATGGLTYGNAYANVAQFGATQITGNVTPVSQFDLSTFSGFNSQTFGGGHKSGTLTGWNIGGGFEWMFAPNWSVKAEAIYWNMGNVNVQTASFNSTGANGLGNVAVNYQGVIARAGINYHFNFAALASPAEAVWTAVHAGINNGYGFGTNSNAQGAFWGGPSQANGLVIERPR